MVSAWRTNVGWEEHVASVRDPFWLQHKVSEKAPDILKVVAKQNPADAGAKCVAVKRLGMSQAQR